MPAQAVARAEAGAVARRGEQSRIATLALTLVLVAFAALPRLGDLDRYVTSDERDGWMERAARFYGALQAGRPEGTYQSYHPGVTVTWLGGFSQAAFGVIEPIPNPDPEEPWAWRIKPGELRPALVAARLPFALLASVCIGVAFLLLRRLVGSSTAFAGGLVVAFDPFDLALSRLIHLDATVTHFMLLSLLAALVYWRGAGGYRFWLLSGGFAGLAVLTKAPSAYLFAFVPPAGLIFRLVASAPGGRLAALRRALLDGLVWGALALGLVFTLWPALWTDPVGLVRHIIWRQRTVAGSPHENLNYFLGQVVEDPGALFYPVAYVLRATPLTLAGLALLPLALWRRRWLPAGWWPVLLALLLFGVGFGLLVTWPAKKFDRYLLPAFPPLDLAATLVLVALAGGAVRAWPWAKGLALLGALSFVLQTASALTLHPYYLAWFNPLSGGPPVWSHALMIGWGDGLELAADYLNQKPDAERLRVAPQYGGSFAPFFRGRSFTVREYDRGTIDYVVTYANQTQRHLFPDIERDLAPLTPEHVVRLNGIPYAEIYAISHPALANPVQVTYGTLLALDGYEATPATVRPGEEVRITLRWRALNTAPLDYKAFVHLLDAAGQRHGSRDRPLGTPIYGTSRWLPGDEVTWSHRIRVGEDTPPGPLWIVVGAYDPATGARLPPTVAAPLGPELSPNAVAVGQIQVVTP